MCGHARACVNDVLIYTVPQLQCMAAHTYTHALTVGRAAASEVEAKVVALLKRVARFLVPHGLSAGVACTWAFKRMQHNLARRLHKK